MEIATIPAKATEVTFTYSDGSKRIVKTQKYKVKGVTLNGLDEQSSSLQWVIYNSKGKPIAIRGIPDNAILDFPLDYDNSDVIDSSEFSRYFQEGDMDVYIDDESISYDQWLSDGDRDYILNIFDPM
jgi:hypothetical protein